MVEALRDRMLQGPGGVERPFTAEEMVALAESVDESFDCSNYRKFKCATYTRNRVHLNEHFELVVICWEPGQASSIHDHGRSNCLYRVIQGTMIGLFGTIFGVGAGVLVASYIDVIIPALEQFFHTQFLPTGVYPITELPAQMELPQVVRIAILSFMLSVLATIYPALRAAKTQPAEALRYE